MKYDPSAAVPAHFVHRLAEDANGFIADIRAGAQSAGRRKAR